MVNLEKTHLGPLDRIRAHLDGLTGVSHRLGTWFLEVGHEYDPDRLTTGHIARTLQTSRAAVVRFCKQIGYPGFTEFKAELTRLPDQSTREIRNAAPAISPHVRQTLDMTWRSMESTLNLVSTSGFRQLIDYICRASMVVWFGMPGDAALLAHSAEHKMLRAALSARAISDVNQLEVIGLTMRAGDIIIFLSQSGKWAPVARTFPYFQERGCRVAVITSNATSIMARSADLCLLTAVEEYTLNGNPLALRAPIWALIDVIVVETIARLRPGALGAEHPGVP